MVGVKNDGKEHLEKRHSWRLEMFEDQQVAFVVGGEIEYLLAEAKNMMICDELLIKCLMKILLYVRVKP